MLAGVALYFICSGSQSDNEDIGQAWQHARGSCSRYAVAQSKS